MIALSLLLAAQFAPTYPDFSYAASSSLALTGYYSLPKYLKDVTLQNVVIPAGATLDASGPRIHVPMTASFGIQVGDGTASAVSGEWTTLTGARMVCDGVQATFTDPGGAWSTWKLNGATLPDAILVRCDSGSSISHVSTSFFGTGIHIIRGGGNPDAVHISDFHLYDSAFYGILKDASGGAHIENGDIVRNFGGNYNIAVAGNSFAGDGLCGLKMTGASGGFETYVRDVHVWGGFITDVEDDEAGSMLERVWCDGPRKYGLVLGQWQITAKETRIYPWSGNYNRAYAIAFGLPGGGGSACWNSLQVNLNSGSSSAFTPDKVMLNVDATSGNTLDIMLLGTSSGSTLGSYRSGLSASSGPNDTVTVHTAGALSNG